MPANQEHVHLAWPLWSDLRVIPTHGEFCSLVRPMAIFARSCWVDLNLEDKLPFLEQPIPVMPVPPAGQVLPPDVLNTHTAWVKASKEIFEQELLQTVREFQACKQEEGQSVSSYVLKIKSYIDNLERLGHAMTQNLAVSLILVSLRKEYDSFVQNYNMHSMGKTVTELHAMLKLHEQTLPQKDVAPALHAIRVERIQKNQKKKSHKAAKGNQRKGKAKMGNALMPAPSFAPKPKNPPTPKKDNPVKDAICHQCGEVGIFTIELYSFLSTSWVYDTGYGTHIYISTEGLRGSRKLKPEALSLCVGDGHRAAVEAIGEFHLCLPSGLVLILHNCHYAPSITRGIISVSRLYKDGFVNRFENDNTISVSKNNLVYFCAIPRDDIYKIDLSSSNTNDSYMYVVSNKRAKLNLDSTLLWHCRLRHISKKCIEKLQHDGLLNSTNIKSFEKCVPCMSGKMARKPYSYQVERAKDLLGLIHTDVCGLFKIVSRQGESYFVTFTDDFSHYGYVYLLKHKHEVFETFKVFQKEVESQLGKTIKSLRSDRGVALNWEDGQAPKLSYLKVWGCEALVKRDTLTKPDKLEPRSIKTIRFGNWMSKLPSSMDIFPKKSIWCNQKVLLIQNILTEYASSRFLLMDFKSKSSRANGNKRFDDELRKFGLSPAANPSKLHWTTVKNILKYLRNTKDMFLVYGGDMKQELKISCYTDAGYLTDAGDLKSQTRYVFVLNEGVVDWKSTKQSIFVTSSTDAEYIAALMHRKRLYGFANSFMGLELFPQLKNL
ncbi:zinc finger, CCHC-type containing protein [Tanacetum coccineum]